MKKSVLYSVLIAMFLGLVGCAKSEPTNAQKEDGKCRKAEETPLMEAMRKRDVAKIKKLIKKGEDPNEEYCGGYPPIILAIATKDREVIKAMVEGGANIENAFLIVTAVPGDKIADWREYYDLIFEYDIDKATLLHFGRRALQDGNREKALVIFKHLKDKNDEEGTVAYATTLYGSNDKKEEKEALKLLKELGDKNVKGAAAYLGWIYYTGEGVKQDYKESFRWYTKAANKNDGNSMVILGFMHLGGLGTEPNPKKAFQLWSSAYKNEQHLGAKGLLNVNPLGGYEEYTRFMVALSGMLEDDFNAPMKTVKWLQGNEVKNYLIDEETSDKDVEGMLTWLKFHKSMDFNFAYAYEGLILMSGGQMEEGLDRFEQMNKLKNKVSAEDLAKLPKIDASTDKTFKESAKKVMESVPSDKKDFYTKCWQFVEESFKGQPKILDIVKPEFNGKNYVEMLDIMTAMIKDFRKQTAKELETTKDNVVRYAKEYAINDVQITNYKYDKEKHVLEMDVQNKAEEAISALQFMASANFTREDKFALYIIDFPLLKKGKKVHIKETIDREMFQEQFEKVSEKATAVVLQTYDADKMVVQSNNEFVEELEKMHSLVNEIDTYDEILKK